MAAKGEPGAGLERARWVEWLIRSKLLYEMHIVTQIRESSKRCSFVVVTVLWVPSAYSEKKKNDGNTRKKMANGQFIYCFVFFR